MLFFGDQLEAELKEEDAIMRRSAPQNMLDLLNQEFTEEEYQQMRISQGKSGDGKNTLRQWVFRGLVARDEVTGMYVKTDKYLSRSRDL